MFILHCKFDQDDVNLFLFVPAWLGGALLFTSKALCWGQQPAASVGCNRMPNNVTPRRPLRASGGSSSLPSARQNNMLVWAGWGTASLLPVIVI